MSEVLERLRRSLSGRYRIERELGRGGMAVVFLAEELRHGRPVAIKVMQQEIAESIGSERFLREITIAARLQNPHILPLLDSGDADGLLYYVMPFVEGESLRDRLAREKQLPVEDAVRLAGEIANALDYAHSQGVVHRDIKPENVLLSGGEAMIADFGIARALDQAGGAKLTHTGTSIGTPVYMSPEQALGTVDVDGRSDIYSLGCVLYEMLAGQPPFTGPTAQSIVQQHIAASPRAVTMLRAAVPPAIDSAILRALGKAPADRFQTAREFARVLHAPTPVPGGSWQPAERGFSTVAETVETPRPAPQRQWLSRSWPIVGALAGVLVVAAGALLWRTGWLDVAIARFRQVPATRQQVIVADFEGPADDPSLPRTVRDLVIEAMDQSRRLESIPRDQIKFGLRQAGKPDTIPLTPAIARELAVRAGLHATIEGRISRIGTRYSVGLRLTNPEDGSTLRAATIHVGREDDLIAGALRLTRSLERGLPGLRDSSGTARANWSVSTPSFEAFRAFSTSLRLGYAGDTRGALAACRRAVAIDSGFALAWQGMTTLAGNLGLEDSARFYLTKAMLHSDRLTELQRFRMDIEVKLASGEYATALDACERMGRLYGTGPLLENRAASAFAGLGLVEQALGATERAIKLYPFRTPQTLLVNKCLFLGYLGRANEVRAVIPQLTGWGPESMTLEVLCATNEWARAESLSLGFDRDPTRPAGVRWMARRVLSARHAVRGQLNLALGDLSRAAEASREGDEASDTAKDLLSLAVLPMIADRTANVGWPAGRSEVLANELARHGVFAASVGDSSTANRIWRELGTPANQRQPEYAGARLLIRGLLRRRTGDWTGVVHELEGNGRLAGAGPVQVAGITRATLRWTLGDAYEHLAQLDSAAVYFELALNESREYVQDIVPIHMLSSLVRMRLVELYVRMDQISQAERHWAILERECTDPDPDIRLKLEHARATLASARDRPWRLRAERPVESRTRK